MYKVRITSKTTKEIIKEEVCEDEDNAVFYYQELVMRQNSGEEKLQGLDFTVIIPHDEYENYCQKNDNFVIPEPDFI